MREPGVWVKSFRVVQFVEFPGSSLWSHNCRQINPRSPSLSAGVSIHGARAWGESAHLEVSNFRAQEPRHVGGLWHKGEIQCLDFSFFSHWKMNTTGNAKSRIVTRTSFLTTKRVSTFRWTKGKEMAFPLKQVSSSVTQKGHYRRITIHELKKKKSALVSITMN